MARGPAQRQGGRPVPQPPCPDRASDLRKRYTHTAAGLNHPGAGSPTGGRAAAGTRPDQACGCLAVAGLLIEASRCGPTAERLALCNSEDTAGSRDSVVGYGAWMFALVAL